MIWVVFDPKSGKIQKTFHTRSSALAEYNCKRQAPYGFRWGLHKTDCIEKWKMWYTLGMKNGA